MKHNTIIFDMDGVIVDSEPLHVRAELQTCADHDIKISPAEWTGFKGRTATDIFSHINDRFADGQHKVTDLIDHKTNLFVQMVGNDIELITGIEDFLSWCRNRFTNMGLATSSNARVQRAIFKRFNLDQYFDTVVTGDMVTRGKPNPEPYLLAMSKLGVQPAQTIVVEDSGSGIASALAAGTTVVGITTSHDRKMLQGHGSHVVIDNYEAGRTLPIFA